MGRPYRFAVALYLKLLVVVEELEVPQQDEQGQIDKIPILLFAAVDLSFQLGEDFLLHFCHFLHYHQPLLDVNIYRDRYLLVIRRHWIIHCVDSQRFFAYD